MTKSTTDEIQAKTDANFANRSSDKLKVYKADGSLQCNMGKKIATDVMQKDLGSVKVFSAENKPDGMMHIQQCGTPTGTCNVYEISKNDLDAAKKAGFKLWTGE
jgi:hypothetical protein